MQKSIFFGLFLFGLAPNIHAQLLPNMGFENWQRSSNNKYDEPTGGVWATPNPTLDVATFVNTPFVEKVTAAADVQNGNAAAKLTTRSIFGIKGAGTIFSGKFIFNASAPTQSAKLGVPFTARPTHFKGYYKTAPVNGDSALMYARLTKRVNGQQIQVGIARKVVLGTVANYTLFDLPFTYQTTDVPDSIIVVFTSSAAADNLNAPQVGSVLWIDNTALEIRVGTSLNLERMLAVETFPNPATERVNLRLSAALKEAADVQFWTIDGKMLAERPLEIGNSEQSVPVADLPTGSYFYNIVEKTKTVIATGRIEIVH